MVDLVCVRGTAEDGMYVSAKHPLRMGAGLGHLCTPPLDNCITRTMFVTFSTFTFQCLSQCTPVLVDNLPVDASKQYPELSEPGRTLNSCGIKSALELAAPQACDQVALSRCYKINAAAPSLRTNTSRISNDECHGKEREAAVSLR
ncbi:hypothetical protein CBL_09555 [Carabus blaptoides fortunei]